MLFPCLAVRPRREPGRQRLQVPQAVGSVPPQQATEHPQELIQRVVEVQGGAAEHPHPQDHQPVQSDVQQVQHQAREGGYTRRLQVGHGRRLLHDEERRVRQDEGVSGDVVAEPVEAGASAGGFGGELGLHRGGVQGERSEAGAGRILDVEEGLGEDVPDGGGDGERQQPPRQEGHVTVQGRVGQEHEGSEEQQRPAPRHFHEIQVEDVPAAAEICFRNQLQLLQQRARDGED